MKIYYAFAIVALLCSNLLSASEKPLIAQNSKIEKVTVFLQGATIERSASVQLRTGVNELVFDNLSPDIIENSIQLRGLKDASILSIAFNLDYLDKKNVSAEYESLETRLDELLFERNAIQSTIEGYERELKLLSENQRINSDKTDLSLEKIKQISTYYRQRSTEIQNTIYKQKRALQDLERDINDHRQQMNNLEDSRKEMRGEITVKLQAESASYLNMELSYNIENAGWFPFYDIRANNTADPIELNYKASVYQQSGIDWDDVNLVLSTGDPNTNNLKPDLQPKYLNFVNRNYKRSSAVSRNNFKHNPTVRSVSGIVTDDSGAPLPGVNIAQTGSTNGTTSDFNGKYRIAINNSGGNELRYSYVGFETQSIPVYASMMNVRLEANQEALEEVVVVGYETTDVSRALAGKAAGVAIQPASYNENVQAKEESLTNTRFEIKKRYTIVSNSDITTIEIDAFNLPANYQHYAAPELNENVFLTATVTDWERYDLLQGEANIYFEGSYAGKTAISPLATTDSLEISLGIDPNIIIKREKKDNFKSKSLLGGTRVVTNAYEISVRNSKSSTINLLLEDRIPVSQNKEIKISDQETADADYDEQTGILKWKIELAPKASATKNFSYEVRYPKDRYINL
ncbi:mucoidy inhibitor MuiA family protein [Leeuwenhoekiella sp. ZYFB001]|uniref:mucoidy inhibitor MuiA family protein n=1 Tax=Leeuwenhoekiella sp. ZYFB001 TaxID=2719912 RepID=UPI001431682F|nr:mucoidy inhibitor MuiA family protein [Leeuwenhoekiella sp. ZYFB001]